MVFPPGHDPVRHIVEDIHSALTHHNPVREVVRDLHEHDVVDDIFASVLNDTYGRHSDYRSGWRRPAPIQDDFYIDFSIDFSDRHDRRHDRHDRHNRRHDRDYMPVELNRTSSELMRTLHSHFDGMNIGKHRNAVTRDELRNYLVRVGDEISPQDKTDLLLVMRGFDRINRAAGREGKGITLQDMACYVMDNQRNDRLVMIERQNERLRETNAQLRDEINGRGQQVPGGRDGRDSRQSERTPADQTRVITERNGPREHYLATGSDLTLSQKAFEEHYGIKEKFDFLKFMPGKPNDGQVPNFWTGRIAEGLGGRDDGVMRWDKPNHHDLATDFQRNFAQLSDYFIKLPPDQQTEFTLNFARTQEALFRAHGATLLKAENETISFFQDGKVVTIDLVENVGKDTSRLHWLAV